MNSIIKKVSFPKLNNSFKSNVFKKKIVSYFVKKSILKKIKLLSLKKNFYKELLFLVKRKKSFSHKKDKREKTRKWHYNFENITRFISKDVRFRMDYNMVEKRKNMFQFFSYNQTFPKFIRDFFYKKYSVLPSRVYIKNRCLICGKTHSVYKKWRLSRICFREKALLGKLHGITKF